ncbi:MAG: hypothetical protein P0Y59_01165 [Candidatus Sphingomonas phytovorans]|nr:hypothetical protein [Sphingomonas sp.]WEK00336.1 MAG: hypothetical protein P0Y59_01165 [Sphingomonas sp.]
MPNIVSTAANDYNLSVSEDGRLTVFARSEANFERSRIFFMEKRKGSWTAPAQIAFGDARYRDTDPWLTPDGRWLYFTSDRPAPGRSPARKDRDIWRVERTTNGGWGAPEHLAAASSPGEELGPELHGTTLYFNSSRPGGPGKLDIYGARLRADGEFDAPVALQVPINSPSSEGDFTLSSDGRSAYFWSSRGGTGAIYVSQRAGDGWGEATPLARSINDGDFTFGPSLSRDSRVLTYASTRPRPGQPKGMADIYQPCLP